jgi:hypothetical protein
MLKTILKHDIDLHDPLSSALGCPEIVLHRPVVGPLRLLREVAGRKLPASPVVSYAFTAFSPLIAGICAGTHPTVPFQGAFHGNGLSLAFYNSSADA